MENSMPFEPSLTELFVRAAFGILPPLETGDDLTGHYPFRGLGDEANGSHCGVENVPALSEAQNALVEQSLQKGDGDSASS